MIAFVRTLISFYSKNGANIIQRTQSCLHVSLSSSNSAPASHQRLMRTTDTASVDDFPWQRVRRMVRRRPMHAKKPAEVSQSWQLIGKIILEPWCLMKRSWPVRLSARGALVHADVKAWYLAWRVEPSVSVEPGGSWRQHMGPRCTSTTSRVSKTKALAVGV